MVKEFIPIEIIPFESNVQIIRTSDSFELEQDFPDRFVFSRYVDSTCVLNINFPEGVEYVETETNLTFTKDGNNFTFTRFSTENSTPYIRIYCNYVKKMVGTQSYSSDSGNTWNTIIRAETDSYYEVRNANSDGMRIRVSKNFNNNYNKAQSDFKIFNITKYDSSEVYRFWVEVYGYFEYEKNGTVLSGRHRIASIFNERDKLADFKLHIPKLDGTESVTVVGEGSSKYPVVNYYNVSVLIHMNDGGQTSVDSNYYAECSNSTYYLQNGAVGKISGTFTLSSDYGGPTRHYLSMWQGYFYRSGNYYFSPYEVKVSSRISY